MTADARIEVEPLDEVECDGEVGNQFGYYARGHHEPEKFIQAADYYGGENGDPEWLRWYESMTPQQVTRTYWRTVPIMFAGECEGLRFVEAEGPGHGAFPVTVIVWRRKHDD